MGAVSLAAATIMGGEEVGRAMIRWVSGAHGVAFAAFPMSVCITGYKRMMCAPWQR